MKTEPFEMGDIDIAWCPGCGNYNILNTLKQALTELNITPQRLCIVSGIGQAGKIPHYLRTNVFDGLHGRALPVATAIKAVNPGLTVIAESGDGDMYGEGGSHFIHTIRRNPNIVNIVHNNMIYGLTKGQASPTSQKGLRTPVQVEGVFNEPFNPLSVAIALDVSFVARAFSGDEEKTKEILKKAILHKGYALVDLFHPCVTFNKVNTFMWYRKSSYYLDNSHDPYDRVEAFSKAIQTDKFSLGILYMSKGKKTFEENLAAYISEKNPVFGREPDIKKLQDLIESKKNIENIVIS